MSIKRAEKKYDPFEIHSMTIARIMDCIRFSASEKQEIACPYARLTLKTVGFHSFIA
jgi:hypothetical protein